MFLLVVLDAFFSRGFQTTGETIGGSRYPRGHQLTLGFSLSCLSLGCSPGFAGSCLVLCGCHGLPLNQCSDERLRLQ